LTGGTKRILSLLVRHGMQKYPHCLIDNDRIFETQLPQVQRQTIIIDNALPPDHCEAAPGNVTVIGGDNSSWEFSAWDKGIAFAGKTLRNFDLVHLVTSAFHTLNTSYLAGFSDALLDQVIEHSAVCGHIDFYPKPVAFFGDVSQHWLRSAFVFLPPSELLTLGSLVSVGPNQRAALFSGMPGAPFAQGNAASAQYQRYILDWLTGNGTGQGTSWHSRFDLSADTLGFFENKALAIFNEHSLSMRLRAQGCRTIDTLWGANQIAQHGALPKILPRWRDQLRDRAENPASPLPAFTSISPDIRE